jgi:hypothetical protein
METDMKKTFKKDQSTITVDVISGVYCYDIVDKFSPLGVRITPPSVLIDYGADVPPRQHEMYDISTDGFLEAYREQMKDHVPSAEEQYELQAAFGKGETVVNVTTGQKYTT